MKNPKFKVPKEKQTLFEMQEEILDFWAKNKIFERSIDERPQDNTYSFFDGPPFITGTPHYATLLPSIAKDIIPRFKTMKGYRVRRVWGWDCHGLPAETKVEKKLGLKSKRDIEKLGVDKFVAACREYVSKVSGEWPWYIQHIGRWADMEHAYRTMDRDYMESVIWVFKELYDKNLIYKGRRSSLYCTRCATPLSKFEITMDDGFYREVTDPSVSIKFKVKGQDKYLVAWTTTPWTLPANAALAVDQKEIYAEIEIGEQRLILAEKTLPRFADERVKIVKKYQGTELVGLEYEPLYNFLESKPNDYKVYSADFITMEDGTGIVHVAPAFGEVDFLLGKEKDLSIFMTIDEEGKFIKEVTPWTGMYFKKTDVLITQDLKERSLLFKEETTTHSYPFCYRCETPLIYKAQEAWYLNIEKLRSKLIKTNTPINWIPSHFKNGRFEYNLKNAPDWCLSRSRYWGSPIPVWECDECAEVQVIGSIAELEKLSGKKVTDLYRPDIDQIELACTKCAGKSHRVKEVLDCWFESGAMPYAERHYPFENQKDFENGFPADFIIEYTGQLRGWFYYLHVISNALKESPAFKNVVVTGVLKGTDGRKMSKSFGNYPDPKATIEKYGGETLRLYFMSNLIMKGEDMNVSEGEIQEHYRKVMQILWNSYKYFLTYANLHDWKPDQEVLPSEHVLDRWIIGELEISIEIIGKSLEAYDYPTASRAIRPFVENLSTWYIRLSRDRFATGNTNALQTLYGALIRFSTAIAPLLPFTAEAIYQNLVRNINTDSKDSVHLCMWPDTTTSLINSTKDLRVKMEEVRTISHIAHSIRGEKEVPLRQPLTEVFVVGAKYLKESDECLEILKQEINVKKIKFGIAPSNLNLNIKIADGFTVALSTDIPEELLKEGLLREIIRAIQNFRKTQGLKAGEIIGLSYFTTHNDIKNLIEEKRDEIMKVACLGNLAFSTEKSIEVLSDRLFLEISK